MSEKSEREHESTQETEGKIDLFEFFSDFLRGFRRIWWLIPPWFAWAGGLTFGRAVRQYRPHVPEPGVLYGDHCGCVTGWIFLFLLL